MIIIINNNKFPPILVHVIRFYVAFVVFTVPNNELTHCVSLSLSAGHLFFLFPNMAPS